MKSSFDDRLAAPLFNSSHVFRCLLPIISHLAIVEIKGHDIDITEIIKQALSLLFDMVVEPPPLVDDKEILVGRFGSFEQVSHGRLTIS